MHSRPKRWLFIVVYGLVCASNQMLWLTFAPITTPAANYYHVTANTIGLLAEIFPFAYFLFAIPFGKALDKNFRGALTAGTVLNATGALIRGLSNSFYGILIGQILIAISQPLLLNAITRATGEYLDERDRPNGLAFCSASLFIGMLASNIFGMILHISKISDLLASEAWVTLFLTVLLILATIKVKPLATNFVEEDSKGAVMLMKSKSFVALLGIAAVGFGAFIALTTWLQSILSDRSVSSNSSDLLLVIMVIMGTIGAAVLPGFIASKRLEKPQLYVTTVGTTLLCVIVALIANYYVMMIAMAVGGFLLIGALPTILELADRAGKGATGIASGLVWLAGNGGGLVIALVVQALVKSPLLSFMFLALMTFLAIFLVPWLAIENDLVPVRVD